MDTNNFYKGDHKCMSLRHATKLNDKATQKTPKLNDSFQHSFEEKIKNTVEIPIACYFYPKC